MYKPYSPEWHRRRYLLEALNKYLEDGVDNEVIYGDILDILMDKMTVAVEEVNKIDDLIAKIKE